MVEAFGKTQSAVCNNDVRESPYDYVSWDKKTESNEMINAQPSKDTSNHCRSHLRVTN